MSARPITTDDRPRSPGPTAVLGFRAMSTDVAITVVGGDAHHLAWARARVAQLEQRWSRFLPDSEISRLNGAAGTPLEVSEDTVEAVAAACAAWVVTHGAFDPTVHDSLLRLGYDDTIDTVRGRDGAAPCSTLPAPGCAGVVFDRVQRIVRLPEGVRLDLGGIGKGLAADLTVAGLLAHGAAGALVSIGGDVRVAGTPPNGEAWVIAVEDPRDDQPIATVELLDGGVATSTTLRRRWRAGHRTHHHLVEPTTGTSTGPEVVGAAVVADTAAWADALSKVPFVETRPADRRPSAHPPHRRLDAFRHAGALVMLADGSHHTLGDFPGRLVRS